jgi:hypothetical protein
MKAFFGTLVVAFLFATSLSFGQIQKDAVNGWHIVDTLNAWEASSRVVSGSNIGGGNNYQIFRFKTYDAGKPSYVEFEKRITKIQTPIGFAWWSGLVNIYPTWGYARYLFSIGDSSGWYEMEQPGEFPGGYPFSFVRVEGYFRTSLPDSIDRIKIRIYPAPYSGNTVRFIELGLDFLNGIVDDAHVFLIDPFEDTTVVGVEDEPNLPSDFRLFQNYPNPFNPTTSIKYSVESIQYIQIAVYNILGQEVQKLVDEEKFPGEYTISFDGSNLPSGIYFYRLQTDSFSETKKMILQK